MSSRSSDGKHRYFISAVVLAAATISCQMPEAQERRPEIEPPPLVQLKKGDAVLVVGALEEITEEREEPAREGAAYIFSRPVLPINVVGLGDQNLVVPLQRVLGDGPGTHNSRDNFGFASLVGDFDEDGKPDLVIANPGAGRPPNNQRPGLIHYLQLEVGSYAHRQTLRKGFGRELGLPGLLGWSLATADVNGDGHPDLIAGAPGHPNDDVTGTGAVFIYLRRPVIPANAPGIVFAPFASLLTAVGLAGDGTQTLFGSALGTGDFDGDGLGDLIVGAPLAADQNGVGAGALFTFHGTGDGFTPWARLDQSGFSPNAEDDHLGAEIAVGDFDGDGDADVAASVPQEDFGTEQPDAGLVMLFNGGPDGLTAAGFLDPRDRMDRVDGIFFGTRMVAADFDGDGIEDLAVAAPYARSVPERDLTLVTRDGLVGSDLRRPSGSIVRRVQQCFDRLPVPRPAGRAPLPDNCFFVDLPAPGGQVRLPPLERTGLVLVYRGSADGLKFWQTLGAGVARQVGHEFGMALHASDLDRDGRADLVVGAPRHEIPADSGIQAGAAFVYRGGAERLTFVQTLSQSGLDVNEQEDKFGGGLNR